MTPQNHVCQESYGRGPYMCARPAEYYVEPIPAGDGNHCCGQHLTKTIDKIAPSMNVMGDRVMVTRLWNARGVARVN